MEEVEAFLIKNICQFNYFYLFFVSIFKQKNFSQLFFVYFSMLNSNLFSDLIYHKRFERYFSFTKPQNQNL